MSYVFDTMQEAIELLNGPHKIKVNLRFMLDRLHKISHETDDSLNFDEHLRRQAYGLETNLRAIKEKMAK